MNPTSNAFSSLFNSLVRGERYRFQMTAGVPIDAVMHHYGPDGTIHVSNGKSIFLNPLQIVYVKELS